MTVALHVWTVYDHPADDPKVYVARRFDVVAGNVVPTERTLRSQDLEDLRRQLEGMGLVCLQRDAEADDPVIIETWL